MRKTLYTLNIDNYEPAICDLTYPLMKHYANKIGAQFHIISERKFPDWPVTYEKLQVAEFASAFDDEWSIFIDSDTLINPEMFDVTEQMGKDTVCHNGKDFANVRWSYDKYFRRDGRGWGSCNWFTVGSEWTRDDLWRPLDDLTLEQALANIHITVGEHNSGHCKTEHLIDDYTLSRNIARFGLKATTVGDICGNLGWKGPDGKGFSPFLFHLYTLSSADKLKRMIAVLTTPNGKPYWEDGRGGFQQQPTVAGQPPAGAGWGLMTMEDLGKFKEKWGV